MGAPEGLPGTWLTIGPSALCGVPSLVSSFLTGNSLHLTFIILEMA